MTCDGSGKRGGSGAGAHGERQTAFSTCFEKADGFRVVGSKPTAQAGVGQAFSDHSSAPSAGASFAVALRPSLFSIAVLYRSLRTSFPVYFSDTWRSWIQRTSERFGPSIEGYPLARMFFSFSIAVSRAKSRPIIFFSKCPVDVDG